MSINDTIKVLSILIGGELGLMLGYVGSVWITKADPLKVSPTVCEYAPWLLPDEVKQ